MTENNLHHKLLSHTKGDLRFNEPMSKHTSWKAGGNAKLFYIPASLDDLKSFLNHLPTTINTYFIGLGSNLLVRDNGFDGVIVCMKKGFKDIKIESDGTLYAEAGVSSAKIAKYTTQKQRYGLEFLAGIPGTLGGALAMNAGAFGGTTWNHVEKISVLSPNGLSSIIHKSDVKFGYRFVDIPKNQCIVAGWLNTTASQNQEVEVSGRNDKIRQLLKQRSETQPVNTSNAGSVFKNPKGESAAWLIEKTNLKGLSIGDAVVSSKHANFIINKKKANAAQIESVIKTVQKRVFEDTGVYLETEVQIIGDK